MGRVTDESNINYLRNYLGLTKEYSRQDICRHLRINVNTKLEDIFIRENLHYRKHYDKDVRLAPAQEYFLVNVESPFSSIYFDSGHKVLSEAILANEYDRYTLHAYVNEKYPVLYYGSNYIVSREPRIPRVIEYRCPFNLSRIRQKLRDMGYNDIHGETTLGDICRRLDIPRDQDSVKRKICDKIGIPYYSISHGSVDTSARKVCSVDSLGRVQDFDSIRKSAEYFNLYPKQLCSYIENNVRFTYEDKKYRVYYV